MDCSQLNWAVLLVLIVQAVTEIGGEENQMKILTRPDTFQHPVGSNVTMPCAVLNLDDSVVTWTKAGQVISANTFKVLQDPRISVESDGGGVSLSLSDLKLTDGGEYECTLNLKQRVLRDNVVHSLKIEVPPEIHHLRSSGSGSGNGTVTVRRGSTVRLECRARGQPRPTVYWSRKHNLPFPWGLGTNLTVSGEKLVMKDVTRSYSGDYVCNADNGVGRWPVRQMVSLDVLYPPEVTVESSWLHCGEGETVTLICRVYANPAARVLWYKETMKLIEGERLQLEQVGDTYRLILRRVRLQDHGKYYCRASNILAKESSGPIVLTGAPSIPLLVGDLRSSQTSRISPESRALTAGVSMAETNNSYTMMGLQNNTGYAVVVRSQNKFGWSPFSRALKFQTMDKVKLGLTLQEKPRVVPESQGRLKSEPVVSYCNPLMASVWLTAVLLPLLLIDN